MEDFDKKDKINRYDRSSFEGVGAICRLWGRFLRPVGSKRPEVERSLQVGEINAKMFAMG